MQAGSTKVTSKQEESMQIRFNKWGEHANILWIKFSEAKNQTKISTTFTLMKHNHK